MGEYFIQIGSVGGEGPVNYSFNSNTGAFTDHGTQVSPDGLSVKNVYPGQEEPQDPAGSAEAQHAASASLGQGEYDEALAETPEVNGDDRDVKAGMYSEFDGPDGKVVNSIGSVASGAKTVQAHTIIGDILL